jgi:hypothetical protein
MLGARVDHIDPTTYIKQVDQEVLGARDLKRKQLRSASRKACIREGMNLDYGFQRVLRFWDMTGTNFVDVCVTYS